MPKQFIWLIDSQSPRYGWPDLVKDAVHNVDDYSAEVVAEWVKSGVAKWVDGKKKTKESD